jgi:FKBP-type peptidyl-prolyl cis-trans isomerase FklB
MTLKSILSIALFTVISLNISAQNKKAGPKKPMPKQANNEVKSKVISMNSSRGGSGLGSLTTDNDSLSYAIGVNIGQSLKQQGMENINLDLLKSAMNDVLKGNVPQIEPDKCMPVIMASMKKVQEKKFAPLKAEGLAFLAANKKKADVTTLPSGLQYTVMTKGTGEIPVATDKVNVHYHGTLLNGSVFDSSVDRGTPATFGVTQVIAGWVEALQLMPVGSKWKLFIPSDLAYGERGAGENIPPFSTLQFEVELLSIEKAPVVEEKK